MYQKTDNSDTGGGSGQERPRKRIDLSVPQVAGSALAAIAAAILASRLDVYGTVIGAGVVSVIATCGGSIFHYLFRRTGEQLRDSARPKARQIPVANPRSPADTRFAWEGSYGEATTHGSRRRGRKRPLIAAVLVFVVAMVLITGYELASGGDLSGGTGTTVSSVVTGGNGGSTHHGTPPRDRGRHGGGGAAPSAPPRTNDPGTHQDPGRPTGAPSGSPTATPTPTPTPSTTGAPSVSPTPTPSDSADVTTTAPTDHGTPTD